MNKSELVDAIASGASLSKENASKALKAALEAITEALKNGARVQLTGFGSFMVRTRGEHMGRNPQTGASVTIKASKIAAFKAGKGLKDAIN